MLRIFNNLPSVLAAKPIRAVVFAGMISLIGVPASLASVVALGAAGNYGIVIGNDATSVTLDHATVSGGALAIGTLDNNDQSPYTLTHVTSSGVLEGGWGNNCSPTQAGSCTHNYSFSSSSIGTATRTPSSFNPSTPGDPISDALAAVTQATADGNANYTGYSGTGSFSALNKGSVTRNSGQNLTLTALTSLADNVFLINDLTLNGGSLTLDDQGVAGRKFAIDVTGDLNFSNNAKIILAGATTAADVLFNIESNNNSVSITGSNSLFGTILAPDQDVSVSGSTITGEIIAGLKNAHNISIQGHSTVNFQAFSPPARTPEPGTLALFGTGIAAFAAVRRRRQS